MPPAWSVNLGLIEYQQALDLQHRLVTARAAGAVPDLLLLLEHPPVITLGRHGDASNIVAPQRYLDQLGIPVHRVERAGDVTYHGPGQLVGYPIVDLAQHQKSARWYVLQVGAALVKTLADFGIQALLEEDQVGVWVGKAKIAAMGARIQNWITFHGFALNVDPRMAHFELIVPCGITDKAVCSMAQVLGTAPEMSLVRQRLAWHLAQALDWDIHDVSPEALQNASNFLSREST